MLGATLTLLSPSAAALGLLALAAVAATLYGQRRADAVRRTLRLPAPSPRDAPIRLALAAAVVALLTLTVAQPALTRDRRAHTRRDVQVLFVLDVSRSMAASTDPRSPTRLERAATAAERMRARVPAVAAGIATLTDRVLPDLLPVFDVIGFDRVLARGVALESPPPQASAVRATSYDALAQVPGAGYFDPKARTRIVVVLTDGESDPVRTGDVSAAYAAHAGYRLLFIRFWRAGEQIYDPDGRAEPAYRADPSGGAVLASLASALGGRAYEEREVGAAAGRLRALVGSGRATASPATVATQTPLAPYTAALALVLACVLLPLPRISRSRVRWPPP